MKRILLKAVVAGLLAIYATASSVHADEVGSCCFNSEIHDCSWAINNVCQKGPEGQVEGICSSGPHEYCDYQARKLTCTYGCGLPDWSDPPGSGRSGRPSRSAVVDSSHAASEFPCPRPSKVFYRQP